MSSLVIGAGTTLDFEGELSRKPALQLEANAACAIIREDHRLREVDVTQGRRRREIDSHRCGHDHRQVAGTGNNDCVEDAMVIHYVKICAECCLEDDSFV